MSGVTMRVAIILTNAFNFKDDKCWWAIKKLAKVVKASEKQVSSAIKVFREHHIFKIASGRTGKANEYKPNFDIILKYPTLASEETLQKVKQFTTDQTIKLNYKLNTTAGSKSKGWGKKPSDPLTVFVKEKNNLEEYVSFVKRCQRLPSISDDMVKEMFHRQLITEEEYKKW